jgi:hypothetical protein
MNWTTLERVPQPEDFEPGARPVPTLTHVCVEGDTFSLCAKVDVYDGLYCESGEHPENADTLDTCSVCWSVFERRRAEERGREPAPTQRLGWTRGPKVAIA